MEAQSAHLLAISTEVVQHTEIILSQERDKKVNIINTATVDLYNSLQHDHWCLDLQR